MKTIEEVAIEYAEKNKKTRLSNHITKTDFKAGVEFFQRWIPVEEELPETENEANGLSKVCICKGEEMADEFAAYYDEFAENWKIYPIGLMTTVTHWRPIEYK